MRHVVIEGPRRVTVAEAPDAVLPGADGVVVAVDATAICGSDMHFYDGDIPVGTPAFPSAMSSSAPWPRPAPG